MERPWPKSDVHRFRITRPGTLGRSSLQEPRTHWAIYRSGIGCLLRRRSMEESLGSKIRKWIYFIVAAVVTILTLGMYRRGKVEGEAEQTYTETVKRIDDAESSGDAKSLRDEA